MKKKENLDKTQWVWVCNPNLDLEHMTFSFYEPDSTKITKYLKYFAKTLYFIIS